MMKNAPICGGIFLLALAGCAGSDTHIRMLESENAINVQPSATPGEWQVSIRRIRDIGYDPDRLEDRQRAAMQVMSKQCASPKIVDERVLERGQTALGVETRTYFITVRC